MAGRRPARDDLFPDMNFDAEGFNLTTQNNIKQYDEKANTNDIAPKVVNDFNQTEKPKISPNSFISALIKNKDKDKDKEKENDNDNEIDNEKEIKAKAKVKPKKKKYKLSREKTSEMNADDSVDESSTTYTPARSKIFSKLVRDSESKNEMKNQNNYNNNDNNNNNNETPKAKSVETTRDLPLVEDEENNNDNFKEPQIRNKHSRSNAINSDSEFDDSQSFSTAINAIQRVGSSILETDQPHSELNQSNINNFFNQHRDQIKEVITNPSKTLNSSKINKTQQRVAQFTKSASESFTETAKKVDELEVKFAKMRQQMTETCEKANSAQIAIESVKQNMKSIIETVDSSLRDDTDKPTNSEFSKKENTTIFLRKKAKEKTSNTNANANENNTSNENEEENDNDDINSNSAKQPKENNDNDNNNRNDEIQQQNNDETTERDINLDQNSGKKELSFQDIKNKVVAFFMFIVSIIYNIWLLFYDIMTMNPPKKKKTTKKSSKNSKKSKNSKNSTKTKQKVKNKEKVKPELKTNVETKEEEKNET